jgi:hypothetical protein
VSDYIKDMFIEGERERRNDFAAHDELEQMIEEVSKVLHGATMLQRE